MPPVPTMNCWRPPASSRWELAFCGNWNGVWGVDFNQFFAGDHRVAYLRAALLCDKAQDAMLEVGSDDGIKIWLNGAMVHADNRAGGFAAAQSRGEVHLKPGVNPLLVKVTQAGGAWAAAVRVCTSDGKPLRTVLTRARP